ncbi:MAG: pilus assembly protein PilM [Proteobacteria bacterium]|nr:pilus assembly protein PilM [Pseudomonadota bacterium]
MGKLLLGLDIGSSSAKVCQLKELRGNYEVQIVDRAPFSHDAIVDGSILDRSGVSDVIRGLIKRNNIRQKQCAIAISGYSVIVKRLRLPDMTDDELQENIRWEVEQHIPFDYDDVVVDTAVLERNRLQRTMDILLVASKREVVNDYISVAHDAGLDVKIVDVASFALQNMAETVYRERLQSSCVGIVNVGAAITSMTMITDGVTSFTRDITIGGNQITEEIQKKLGITRDEAEAFKTGNLGSIDAVIPREVEEIVRTVSETIAAEIKRSLNFFYETSSRDSADELLLCGGTLKNDTTLNAFERTLNIPVSLVNPFDRMKYDKKLYTPASLSELALESAVALGLALRSTKV